MSLSSHTPLNDEELYEGFSQEEINNMKAEVKQRWGDTDAYKQSQERVASFTKADMKEIKEEQHAVCVRLTEALKQGRAVEDAEVQALIAQHHAGINRFYDCTPEMYLGLADMYLADPRFRVFYEKYDPELPAYLAAGMRAFVEKKKQG